MNKIRKGIAGITNAISMERLIAWSGRKSVFPFYHVVSDVHLPHIGNLYDIRSVHQFEEDLEFLLESYEPIDILQLERYILNPAEVTKPFFHLTFDDGLREVKDVISPILLKKGIPATFFINSAFLDNKGLFYRYKVSLVLEKLKSASNGILQEVRKILQVESKDAVSSALKNLKYSDTPLINKICQTVDIDIASFLVSKQPYLTTEDCHNLQQKGFSIGSHSLDHPRFRYLDIENQKRQLADCIADLSRKLDINANYFSFPFSDEGVSAAYFQWMYKEQNCRLSFGISGQKDDIDVRHIHRVLMEENDTPAEDILKSEYGYYLLKKMAGKNKISRR